MKWKFLVFVTVFAITTIVHAEDEPDNPEKEKAERDRHQHIQLMTDRLVHKLPQFSLVGPLRRLSSQSYSINGEDFQIDENTRIQGTMRNGADAEVRGFIEPGKPKIANQVVVFDQNGTQNSESDSLDLGHSKPSQIR